MTTKLFLGLLLVAFSAVFGVKLTEKAKTRLDFYRELEEFCVQFLGEIGAFRVTLDKKVQSLPKTVEKIFGCEIRKIASGERADFKDKRFTAEETEFVGALFSEIGRYDEFEQKNVIDYYVKTIKTKKESEEINYRKIANLYVRLGVLGGIAVFIVIA